MFKSYTETFPLRTCDCDMDGGWRPSAILEAMQETASAHCAGLGIGRDVMDGLGIAWVLSRSRVALDQVPRLGETVSVETCPLPPKHLFFPRINTFRDGAGRIVGYASSLWVLLDVNTRRIVSHPEVLAHLPDNRDVPEPIPMPGAIRPLAGKPVRSTLTPPYADFDVNGHVNNTKYLDWCCNALGIEALRPGQIARFDINYETEIRPAVEIRTELAREGDRFTFQGFAGEKRCFCVGGTIIPRT